MEANMAIHRLTKGEIQQSLEQIGLEEYPNFIHDIVCA